MLFLQCAVNLETGEPKDELLAEAKQALAELGCNFSTVSEVLAAQDEKVHKAIMDGLKRYNETQAVSNAQKVIVMSVTACFVVGIVSVKFVSCLHRELNATHPRSRSTTCCQQTSQCPVESWVGALFATS